MRNRAFRMASAYALAKRVFEGEDKAREWFRKPNRELQGERPLDLLDSEIGTAQVVRALIRIEFGIYS